MSSETIIVTEANVLRAISALLTAKKSAAAFAHYPTLRVQTNNLHAALESAIAVTNRIVGEWSAMLSDDTKVATEFRVVSAPLFAYRTIAPALVRNAHQTADFLLDEARGMPLVDVDQIQRIVPSFSDFVKLGAAVRGFLDSLVQAAYQLATFDGLQLNYKFLQSMLSFATVAPPSLHANIVSPEMQIVLNAYVALAGKDRKSSAFTKAAHEQFPQRLLVVCQFAALPDWRRQNIELLFSFCSDFVHSGYVSVLAIGDPGPEVIMGGPGDVFTPRAENFAELKQRLLAECAGVYIDLLLPVLKQSIGRTLVEAMPTGWLKELDCSARDISSVRTILNRQLVEPVRQDLVGSKAIMRINCMCGAPVDLHPPHREWDRFCPECGSRFVFHEVSPEVDYVISSEGLGDVLGGDATKVANLRDFERDKITRIAAKHVPQDEEGEVRFVLITDLIGCDENTLAVPSSVTSAPDEQRRGQCTSFTFVASKSIERCAVVRIQCNCGAEVDYQTAAGTNICRCPRCRTYIGLFGVNGDRLSVQILNPDGTPGTAPIQARNRFGSPGTALD